MGRYMPAVGPSCAGACATRPNGPVRTWAASGEGVFGPGSAFGRRQPTALGSDRAALDAVRRRGLHGDLVARAAAVQLVDLGGAHPHPQLTDLARHGRLDADVVRLVVA